MLFAAEMGLMLFGLLMLIRGKGFGKNAVAHWHYRLLGGFLLTVIPAFFLGCILVGLFFDVDGDRLRSWLYALELATVVVYTFISMTWAQSIRERAMSKTPSEPDPRALENITNDARYDSR